MFLRASQEIAIVLPGKGVLDGYLVVSIRPTLPQVTGRERFQPRWAI